jgi:hypothetical protein
VSAQADVKRRITEAQLCEIAGTSPQRRQGWVKRGWLRKAPRGGGGLRDVLDLVQLKSLIEVLGPTDGPVAWLQVRTDLESPFQADPLDVVFDLQLKHAIVARHDTDLRPLVSHGRPIRILALANVRLETAQAFRRVANIEQAAGRTRAAKPTRDRRGRA